MDYYYVSVVVSVEGTVVGRHLILMTVEVKRLNTDEVQIPEHTNTHKTTHTPQTEVTFTANY